MEELEDDEAFFRPDMILACSRTQRPRAAPITSLHALEGVRRFVILRAAAAMERGEMRWMMIFVVPPSA